MSNFKREDRYLVIKRKHIENHLNPLEREILYGLSNKIRDHAPPNKKIEYVVVESDWPEFEPVWKMLEDRVNQDDQTNVEDSELRCTDIDHDEFSYWNSDTGTSWCKKCNLNTGIPF